MSEESAGKRSPIVVGMLGCGTVGGGVVQVLVENRQEVQDRLGASLEVRRILVRTLDKPRGPYVGRDLLTTDPRAVLEDPEIQVLVELIGGLSPSRDYMLRAIQNGKHIVTANKALLAAHGPEIFSAARRAGVTVAFEASVGGGIPVIRAIREGLVANRIQRISGIINGTSNYILTEMTEGQASFADALRGAQDRGYAEADPTLDVSGGDAAHKLAVLAACAWGVPVDPEAIPREGIDTLQTQDIANAKSLGFVIKSLAVAAQGPTGLSLSVQPTLVPATHVLGTVAGAFNAIYIEGEPVGPLLLYGRGAGAGPTASAVIGDLLEVGRDILSGGVGRVPLPFGGSTAGRPSVANSLDFVSSFYLRFSAIDRPGVLARIAGALGAEGISIASVIQKERRHGEVVPVLVLTHDCPRRGLHAAVREIDRTRDIVGAPTVVLHALTFEGG